MTQEKLEQRAEKFQRTRVVSAKPDYLLFAEFAREELKKAAGIAEKLADHQVISRYVPSIENPLLVAQSCKEIGIAIRKLME